MDVFEKAGIMLLTSRLRRLTERLSQENDAMYKMCGVDFKPKWAPVFFALSDGQAHTITALARDLGQSHVSVGVIVREMSALGLIDGQKGTGDARRNEVSLSRKGHSYIKKIKELWADVEEAALAVNREAGSDLLSAVREWEYHLDKKSLFERLTEIRTARVGNRIEIIPYNQAEHQKAFVELTKSWITQYFPLEESDHLLFADPYAAYVATGGEILVAWDPVAKRLAGTCALIYHAEDDSWEMTKLGVWSDYQHHGVAGRLIDAIITLARERGARRLFLETAQVYSSALRIYHRKGFVKVPAAGHYQRTEIVMVKELD